MGCVTCEHCTGLCCGYIALPLDKPTTRRDFDDVRWYLMHHGVQVFVEDGDWYIQVSTTCRHLQPDNRCGIYETRPTICREYKAGECDYTDAEYDYDHLFTTPEQVEAYAKDWLARKRRRSQNGNGRNANGRNGSARNGSGGNAKGNGNGAARKSAPRRHRVPRLNGAPRSNGAAALTALGVPRSPSR
jgi:Fe-S-cluster containining protein